MMTSMINSTCPVKPATICGSCLCVFLALCSASCGVPALERQELETRGKSDYYEWSVSKTSYGDTTEFDIPVVLKDQSEINTPPGMPGAVKENFLRQIISQNLVTVGRRDLAVEKYGQSGLSTHCSRQNVSGWDDVLDRLVAAASETSIVIINEAHDRPVHRLLIGEFARKLRDHGYDTYAAEAFGDYTSEELLRLSTPVVKQEMGSYTNEPTFARTIVQLREDGYKFLSYDNFTPSPDIEYSKVSRIEAREEAQVRELMSKFDFYDSNSKIIVHVGYSHAREVPQVGETSQIEWMASKLKTATGVDPLTIDQTLCGGDPGPVSLADEPEGETPGSFDAVVLHPDDAYKYGRPEWLAGHDFVSVQLPLAIRNVEYDQVLEVRPFGTSFDTVPVDRLYVRVGEDVRLMVKPGSYQVVSISKEQPKSNIYKLEVSNPVTP